MFEGRSLVIATKHDKEQVITPILEEGLGVHCFVPENYDTDFFGSFSGEIERKMTALETVRAKCLTAMEIFNCDLGMASEGSFGSHPSVFFAQADDEFLIFIDKKNELEIIVRELSLDTNFHGESLDTMEQLYDFANRVHFPSHAIILRSKPEDTTCVIKGITTKDLLEKTFLDLRIKWGSVYAETDMRAMYNPSRMWVIKKATYKLLETIKTACPNCGTPGFSVTDVKSGLPCSCCSAPTRSTLSFIYSCKKCSFSSEKMYPHEKIIEEPEYCDSCKP
jgi:Zn finger protein HypA/HybF involved in hydrogenase expression